MFPFPEVRPRVRERPHQALRGSRRVGSCRMQLTQRSQHYKDVKEKVEDLKPLMERFKQTITATKADGDQAENQRRSEFSRSARRSLTTPVFVNFSSQSVGRDREAIPGVAGEGSRGSVRG